MVVPWTFRARDSEGFPDLTAEMRWYLCSAGVDALFTDDPDVFPFAACDGGD